MYFLLSTLFCILVTVNAIPIENGIVGEPEFACGSQSLILSLNTENPWDGTFYVKNFHADDECKIHGDGAGRNAKLELQFATCGVKRERSLEPRGLFISATVVMSFHKTFLTKIDRAFTVRCFYMEADKTVSQELEVSMLTTQLATIQVPMPVCTYQILDGGPTGDPVQFTTIGQQVYHKWNCETDAVETFCMTVYDCFVDDGTGDRIELLDNDGCSIDKYLLGNLEYPTDLMAGREAHVFKYADRANLYFNCQIRITIKDAELGCPLPQCAANKKKRSVTMQDQQGSVLDVSVPNGIMVADVDLNEADIPQSILHPTNRISHQNYNFNRDPINNEGYCLSQVQFGSAIIMIVACLFITVIVTVVYLMKKNGNTKQQLDI